MSKRLLAVLAACSSLTANAQGLRVLSDHGPAVPIAIWYSHAINDPARAQASPLVSFPVRSDLRPRALSKAKRAALPVGPWLTHAVFLVGTDKSSIQWLAANRAALQAMGAAGLVVNVATPEEFAALDQLAMGLPMAPAASAWLEAQLGLRKALVLPLLIRQDGTLTQHVPGQALGAGVVALPQTEVRR